MTFIQLNRFYSYVYRFLCPKDKIYQDSNDFINTSNSRGWQEFLEKNDYNKENCGAASNFYSRTPQRVSVFKNYKNIL